MYFQKFTDKIITKYILLLYITYYGLFRSHPFRLELMTVSCWNCYAAFQFSFSWSHCATLIPFTFPCFEIRLLLALCDTFRFKLLYRISLHRNIFPLQFSAVGIPLKRDLSLFTTATILSLFLLPYKRIYILLLLSHISIAASFFCLYCQGYTPYIC